MTNIVLGSMTFGGSADLDVSRAIIDAAVSCGITQIDTANMYADGASETIIGTIIQEYSHKFHIASKVGNPAGNMSEDGPLSRASIVKSVEESLSRLNIEALDLLYFHQPDRSTPLEESLAAVEDLRRQGKVLSFGLSNYSSWQIEQIRNFAEKNDLLPPVISQQMYNLLARRVETEYAEYADVSGIKTIAYNPLAGGLLVHLFDQNEIPAQGRFGQSAMGEYYRDRYWNSAQFEAIRALSTIAENAGLSLLELSIRWLISRPLTGGILLGASRPEQVMQNVEAISAGPLSKDLVEACNDATAHLLGIAPNYNR